MIWRGTWSRRWMVAVAAVVACAAALVVWVSRPVGALGTWTDASGTEVSSDVVTAYPGSDHCGWGDADILRLGSQMMQGHGLTGPRGYFVRDPSGVIEATTLTDYEPQGAVPGDATDTGLSTGSARLWLSPDGTAAYLAFDDHVERWPRVDGVLMCG